MKRRHYTVSLTYSFSTITTTISEDFIGMFGDREEDLARAAANVIADEFGIPYATLKDYADVQIEESHYA